MGGVLGAGRGIIGSRPDYEEAVALTHRLREQRLLGRKAVVANAGGPKVRDRPGRESDVLAHGLGWGLGLGLGFWFTIALVFRQFL